MVYNGQTYSQIADALADISTGLPRTASNVEIAILTKLLSPEDATLVSKLGSDPLSAETVAVQTGHSVDDAWTRLVRLGRRGLVNYTSLGTSQFSLRSFEEMLQAQLRKGNAELASLVQSYVEELAQAGRHPDFALNLTRAAQASQEMAVQETMAAQAPQNVAVQETKTPSLPERERGGCLSTWLVVIMVVNALQALMALGLEYGRLDLWVVVLSLAVFGFALAAWNWKRWGVYGLGVLSVLYFLIGMASHGWTYVSGSTVPLTLLCFLVGPKWELFD